MNSKQENLRSFKVDIYEALHFIFNNGGSSQQREQYFGDIYVGSHDGRLADGTIPRIRHLSDRHKMRWYDPSLIMFNNANLALTQVRPHKIVLVYNATPSNRMFRNILIKTLHSSFPNVKIRYE